MDRWARLLRPDLMVMPAKDVQELEHFKCLSPDQMGNELAADLAASNFSETMRTPDSDIRTALYHRVQLLNANMEAWKHKLESVNHH